MLHLLTLPRAEHPIGRPAVRAALLGGSVVAGLARVQTLTLVLFAIMPGIGHDPPQMLMNSQTMPMVSRAPAATPTATPAAVAKNCMSRLPPALLRLTIPAARWCPRGSARTARDRKSTRL